MGYELKLGDFPQGGVLGHQLIRLELEASCLWNTWDGCLPKEDLMKLCLQFAARMGLADAGNVGARRGYVPPANRLEYIREKATDSIKLTFIAGHERADGVIKPDKFGATGATCPGCNAPTAGVKTSLAHNVIPQVLWADIINAALKEFENVVKSRALLRSTDKDGKSLVKSFQTNKSLYTYGDEMMPMRDLIDKSPETMKQLHAINNVYGAQGGSGQQCPNCEKLQSNATLLQRAQLVHDNAIPDSYLGSVPQTTFVGGQWTALTVDPLDAGNSALVKATLRQVGRYMQGLEDRLGLLYGQEENKGYTSGPNHAEPLIFMIWDHYQEFTWCFRAVALKMCQMPYTRTDTALKVKPKVENVVV